MGSKLALRMRSSLFSSIFSLHLAYFTFIFTSDFCCFLSMWNMRNHAFFSLPSETKCSLQFQFSLPKRKRGRTLVWILHDAKMYEIVRKLHYIFSFLRLCCILCNFLRYVTFTFFNVYVLETLRLVTQNVWWCYMKCDIYVLKILRMVQSTLCATTFSNITSCDVNVKLRYVM